MQTKPRPNRKDTPLPADGIVVGVDGSRSALNAVRWAVAEARVRGVGLRIVHAAPYATGSGKLASLRVRSILGVAYTAARRAAPDVAVSTGSSPTRPADALVAAGDTAQLLVVGIPATDSPYELLPTSVALDVVSHASCPVVVVRGRTRGDSEPVMAGVDDPDADAAVLDLAFAEAELHQCGLVVVQAHAGLREHLPGHAAHDEQRAARLDAALRTFSARYPQVEVRTSTPVQDATTALLAAAHNARLLVVGIRQRGAAARVLLGSHSRAMLRHSPVPVLVVDPDVRSATRAPAARPASQT
ncbi:MAG TPA: universal stress protein [Pseudonocardia sp.]|nr:universal stress protein [Pseudonocardia sp.]